MYARSRGGDSPATPSDSAVLDRGVRGGVRRTATIYVLMSGVMVNEVRRGEGGRRDGPIVSMLCWAILACGKPCIKPPPDTAPVLQIC